MFFKRIIGKRSVEADETAAEEAANEASSHRLNRLVSRQRSEASAPSTPDGANAASLGACFSDCAFVVLGVPLTADAAAIHRAVDDLSFAEDVDPQTLSRAQAELLSPRDRMAHELAWLPGYSAEFQQRACQAIAAGNSDALDAVRFSAAGLARLNLACALLSITPRDEALLVGLLNDFPRWDVHGTDAQITEARHAAGIRPAEPAHFDAAVAVRRSAIAAQIADCAAATREGRQALGRAIDTHAEAVRSAANPQLEAVIAAYARTVDPRLQAMQAKIDDAVAALKANPRQPAVLTTIITTLDLWSQFRLPLQKLEEARGLDDPASAKLFGDLRDLGIGLANGHELHGETLRLARALKPAFAAVPGVRPMLERDLPTIIGNVLIDQMAALTSDALANIRKFAAEMRDHGFVPGSGSPRIARLIDCFEQFHEAQPDADAPFVMMRNILIAVNNKASAPALALQMVEWLLDNRVPEAINAQLVQDMCQLQRAINQAR